MGELNQKFKSYAICECEIIIEEACLHAEGRSYEKRLKIETNEQYRMEKNERMKEDKMDKRN